MGLLVRRLSSRMRISRIRKSLKQLKDFTCKDADEGRVMEVGCAPQPGEEEDEEEQGVVGGVYLKS